MPISSDAATGQTRDPASRTIGRWEPKQKRNVWKLDKSLCGRYVEHASAEPATPLLDRLNAGSGPARTIPVSEWQPRQPSQPGPDTRHLAAVWK